MHYLLTTVVTALLVMGEPADQNRAAPNVQLSLITEYGRALFRRCVLNVVLFQNQGAAELSCEYAEGSKGRLAPLVARDNMAAGEVTRVGSLFQAARLYDGGHVGVDETPADGVLEMLKVRTTEGTVVLVASGNKTFTGDPPRRDLLALLKSFEQRLHASAKAAGVP
jgi:hypothetical protein